MANTDEMRAMTTSLLRYALPAVAGSLFTLLMGSESNKHRLENLEVRLDRMEVALSNGGPPLLSRRVDDLQQQMTLQYAEINKKVDNIQTILLRRYEKAP